MAYKIYLHISLTFAYFVVFCYHMCVSTQHITLKTSRYFNPEKTLLASADVPCGHCEQCTMTAKNDLFLRARAEYLDCIHDGGAAIFLTYTYNEDTVPYKRFSLDEDGIVSLTPVDRSVSGSDVLMCFDKSHMTNYLKSLRKSISKIYFDLKNPVDRELAKGSLRYICVPEYGSNRTQRPHYHVIFYLSGVLYQRMSHGAPASNDNYRLCNDIVNYFSQFWSYGIVSASDDGLFVNTESCMNYVTKYVCKNSDLLKFSRFRNFFDFICDAFNDKSGAYADQGTGSLCTPFGHEFKSPMSFFLYYCKFFECAFYVVKSIGFGLSLKSNFQASSPQSFVASLDRGIPIYSHKHAKTLYYRVPRYIVHKLLYNHRSDGTYYLNSFGLKTLDWLRLSNLDRSVRSVRDFDFGSLDTVPLTAFDNFFSKYGLSRSSFPWLIDVLSRHTDKVFVYNMFMRYRAFDSVSFLSARQLFVEYFKGLVPTLDVIRRFNALTVDSEPLTDCLPRTSATVGDYIAACGTSHFVPGSSPGSLHYFDSSYRRWCRIFDMCLDFWSTLTNFCRASLLEEYRLERESSKQLHDILNSRLYGISKNCS